MLWRLGHGLARRKIVIFATANNLASLKQLLLDSQLFSNGNIIEVFAAADIGRAENKTLFLVHWSDFQNAIDDIIKQKDDGCALIVYAPTAEGRIPDDVMSKLDKERNTTVTNFRGRLLNDIVTAMITTSYEKKRD